MECDLKLDTWSPLIKKFYIDTLDNLSSRITVLVETTESSAPIPRGNALKIVLKTRSGAAYPGFVSHHSPVAGLVYFDFWSSSLAREIMADYEANDVLYEERGWRPEISVTVHEPRSIWSTLEEDYGLNVARWRVSRVVVESRG